MSATRLDKVAAGVILANVGVEAIGLLDHGHHEHVFAVVHHLILMFFITELLVRIASTRMGKWELFDGLVITLSLMPMLGEGMLILRVARVARLLHLARHASHLRLLRLPALVRGTRWLLPKDPEKGVANV